MSGLNYTGTNTAAAAAAAASAEYGVIHSDEAPESSTARFCFFPK